MKNKELYRKATQTALDNAFDLFEECGILYDKGKYPRSFVLCLLTLEEVTKSFIYRCVSVGLIDGEKVSEVIRDHREKLINAGHLMLESILNMDHLEKIKDAIKHDSGIKDHREHIFLDVLTKSGLEAADVTIETLSEAQERKNDSIYVDVRDGEIIIPKDVITKEKCHMTISNTGKLLSQIPYLVQANDKEFVKISNTTLWSTVEGIKKEIQIRVKKKKKKK